MTADAVFLTGWIGADAVFDIAAVVVEDVTGLDLDLSVVGEAEFFLVRYPR